MFRYTRQNAVEYLKIQFDKKLIDPDNILNWSRALSIFWIILLRWLPLDVETSRQTFGPGRWRAARALSWMRSDVRSDLQTLWPAPSKASRRSKTAGQTRTGWHHSWRASWPLCWGCWDNSSPSRSVSSWSDDPSRICSDDGSHALDDHRTFPKDQWQL